MEQKATQGSLVNEEQDLLSKQCLRALELGDHGKHYWPAARRRDLKLKFLLKRQYWKEGEIKFPDLQTTQRRNNPRDTTLEKDEKLLWQPKANTFNT